MKDYSEFPPAKYFIRVLKNCCKSSVLYIQIWKNKNKNMRVNVSKKDIRKDYLVSPTLFRNLLAPLMFLNVVTFVETIDKYQIDMLGMKDNEQ